MYGGHKQSNIRIHRKTILRMQGLDGQHLNYTCRQHGSDCSIATLNLHVTGKTFLDIGSS